jgi:alpha-beta hydrolase superfamily lysophospholipase
MFDSAKEAAFVGDEFVKGKIRAVILRFHGLGNTVLKSRLEIDELEWAYSGGLIVHPYYGPWSWMNKNSRALTSEIVDKVYREYTLDDDTPLIITGASMGGHAALIYARYSHRSPAAVACNCPVCDPLVHYSERPDLPRTFIFAYGISGVLDESVFIENSPLEQVENMPDVPYFIIHGDADKSVNKAHSDKFVTKMRQAGRTVEYAEAPGMEHGAFNDYGFFRRWIEFTTQYFLKT